MGQLAEAVSGINEVEEDELEEDELDDGWLMFATGTIGSITEIGTPLTNDTLAMIDVPPSPVALIRIWEIVILSPLVSCTLLNT